MPQKKKCRFVYSNGEKCDEGCFGSYDYCADHYESEVIGPDKDEELRTAEAAFLDAIPPTVMTIDQIMNVLGVIIPQLIWGRVDPKVVGALTKACMAQARLIEVHQIEKNVRRLERLTGGDFRTLGVLDDN